MTSLWCVRTGGGDFAENFLAGGFVGIGWREIAEDLAGIRTREELLPVVRRCCPHIQSGVLLTNYVSEIHAFLLGIKHKDYIIIPSNSADCFHYGVVDPDGSYYFSAGDDGCPLRHRRPVRWNHDPVPLEACSSQLQTELKTLFSFPAETRIHSLLAVCRLELMQDFLASVARFKQYKKQSMKEVPTISSDSPRAILDELMQLKPYDFESTLQRYFAESGVVEWHFSRHCATQDASFDASGEIQVPLLEGIRVHVRCQRFHPGVSIGADAVRALRGLIPYGGQGVFITTADYLPEAEEAAREAGFPLIHLVDGQRLGELLSQHRRHSPAELRCRLGRSQLFPMMSNSRREAVDNLPVQAQRLVEAAQSEIQGLQNELAQERRARRLLEERLVGFRQAMADLLVLPEPEEPAGTALR